jgi:hypothetical protein
MAQYRVYACCNRCDRLHRMDTILTLDDGPINRQSIAKAYKGKRVPPQVARLTQAYVSCRESGNVFVQQDRKQIVLVPIKD